jgi:hypothetical protein
MCSPSCYKSWLNSFRMRIHTPVDWIKAHRFPKFDFCFGRSDFFDEGRRSRISKIAFRWFFGSCVFFTRVEIQFWCEFQKLLFVDFLVRVFFSSHVEIQFRSIDRKLRSVASKILHDRNTQISPIKVPLSLKAVFNCVLSARVSLVFRSNCDFWLELR